MGGPNIGTNPVPLKLRVPSCGTAGRLSTLRRLNSSNLRRPASRNRCRFCSCSKRAESSVRPNHYRHVSAVMLALSRTKCEQVALTYAVVAVSPHAAALLQLRVRMHRRTITARLLQDCVKWQIDVSHRLFAVLTQPESTYCERRTLCAGCPASEDGRPWGQHLCLCGSRRHAVRPILALSYHHGPRGRVRKPQRQMGGQMLLSVSGDLMDSNAELCAGERTTRGNTTPPTLRTRNVAG